MKALTNEHATLAPTKNSYSQISYTLNTWFRLSLSMKAVILLPVFIAIGLASPLVQEHAIRQAGCGGIGDPCQSAGAGPCCKSLYCVATVVYGNRCLACKFIPTDRRP